jgi:hypothetical protein
VCQLVKTLLCKTFYFGESEYYSKGKSKSTKGKSNKTGSAKTKDKGSQHSGIKAGSEIGVEKGGKTLGKLSAGGELGAEKDDQGSGKIKAGVELGLESDSLYEIKEAADGAMDNIKSGFKAAGKKISALHDR